MPEERSTDVQTYDSDGNLVETRTDTRTVSDEELRAEQIRTAMEEAIVTLENFASDAAETGDLTAAQLTNVARQQARHTARIVRYLLNRFEAGR